jgi:thioredoxin-related protein
MAHSVLHPLRVLSFGLHSGNAKIVSILVFIILSVTSTVAQHRKLLFEKMTLKEAKLKAAKEHKLLFLDVITSWCGPCKRMDKEVFTNDSVADYYNSRFINVKIDMENGEGIELAKQFDINSVPTYLFLDEEGRLQHRVASYMNVSRFLESGQKANDPGSNLAYYQKNLSAHQTDIQFIEQYLNTLSSAKLNSEEVVKIYFSLQKEEDLITEKQWEIFRELVRDPYSKELKYILAHKTNFDNKFTSEVVNETIDRIIEKAYSKAAYADPFNPVAFAALKDSITSLDYENAGRLTFEAEMQVAAMQENWNAYSKLAFEQAERYYLNRPDPTSMLSQIVYAINEHVKNPDRRILLEFWAQQAVEVNPYYFTCLVYADDLYRNGKYQYALVQANKAKDFAKKNECDNCVDETNALIKNITKAKNSAKKK